MNQISLVIPLLMLGAACGKKQEPAAPVLPPLPPLQLRPLIDVLHAQAKAIARPGEAVQRELDELAAIALKPSEVDPRTATRAERALLGHDHALAVLEPALKHAEAAVRARAAWLIGRSGQPLGVFPLLFRLKYENDPQAVLWLADALHRLGNHAGLPWIDGAMGVEATANDAGQIAIGICKDCGVAVQEQPTWAQLQAAMQDLHKAWRLTGLVARCTATAPPADAVAARVAAHLVTTQGTLLRPVDEARWVLTRGGQLMVPHLRAALVAEEPYLRTMVLQVAAELGKTAAALAEPILPLLGDPLTAPYALRALGEIGATQFAEHLVARLGVVDTEVRAAAAGALGVLGHAAATPQLQALLADEQEILDVRVQAAFALALLGDAGGTAFLQERKLKGDYHVPMLERLLERLPKAK
ncbi:MAG: HEAT repeat domain-containing protein [Planctomycetes bacterium]|nr:HEAT repeat domain-containing protein [Planctomycetota bacterium]